MKKLLEQYAQLLKVYNPRASEAGLMYALRKQYYLGLRDKKNFSKQDLMKQIIWLQGLQNFMRNKISYSLKK